MYMEGRLERLSGLFPIGDVFDTVESVRGVRENYHQLVERFFVFPNLVVVVNAPSKHLCYCRSASDGAVVASCIGTERDERKLVMGSCSSKKCLT